ncbi:unnamed protein product [Symbiodinium sp. KB8]|nr:unnamed protein product [Symbiodinium sp. KB8]
MQGEINRRLEKSIGYFARYEDISRMPELFECSCASLVLLSGAGRLLELLAELSDVPGRDCLRANALKAAVAPPSQSPDCTPQSRRHVSGFSAARRSGASRWHLRCLVQAERVSPEIPTTEGSPWLCALKVTRGLALACEAAAFVFHALPGLWNRWFGGEGATFMVLQIRPGEGRPSLISAHGAQLPHNVCCWGWMLTDAKPAETQSFAFSRLSITARRRAATVATGVAIESGITPAGVDALREENKSLRSLLATLRWPKLASFVARNRNYPLPWHPPHQSVARSEADLQYLSGVFDGDGCVSAHSAANPSAQLMVAQSYDHPDVLMLFQDAFGGGIYAQRHSGVGLTKPSLVWMVFGEKAKLASQVLSIHSNTKRRQLELLADWPREPSERIDVEQRLRCLKTHDSCTRSHCSWSYCAGFLDADGCIIIKPSRLIEVRFSQKFPTVLEHMREFISEQVGVTSTIYQFGSRHFELRIGRDADSKLVLRHMLEAGLRKKAPQAWLAVNATPETAGHVREAFARSVGNQQFGKRLDEAGVQRCLRINNLQMQLRRCKKAGQAEQAAALSQQVHMLKDEHDFLKAQLENRQLRQYIRMLRELRVNGISLCVTGPVLERPLCAFMGTFVDYRFFKQAQMAPILFEKPA